MANTSGSTNDRLPLRFWLKRRRFGLKRGREEEEEEEEYEEDEEGGGGGEELEPESIPKVVISDPDVLDCPICFDPLTIPVYQCESGHVACSSCCIKCKNVCPSCSEKIRKKCLALEKVLISAKTSCIYEHYGCQGNVSYCDKLSHDETCAYRPYPCPLGDCVFQGTLDSLSNHLTEKHSDSFLKFRFNSPHTLFFGITDKFLILQEVGSGALFALNSWHKLAVKFISSICLSQTRYAYALVVRGGQSSFRFQSFTERSTKVFSCDPPTNDFCLVPEYYFDSSGYLELELCIWNHKHYKFADICKSITDVGESDV